MSLNSLNLDAFYACAQLGNFTKAALRLHITQSALSQRIQHLEEELGTTLLVRSRSGIRLTETGESLIQYCRAKEASETELVARIKTPDKRHLAGVLRVGAFSSVARSLVLPALSGLLSQHPQVQLRLVVREVYELAPLLRSGEIDFLLSTRELNAQGVITQHLGTEKNVLVQKRGYKGPDIFLDHDEEDTTTSDYYGKKDPSKFQRRYLDDIYGIIDAVRLGMGKAVVPLHLIQDYRDIEVVNPSKRLAVPILLHYYEQSFYSTLHKSALEALSRLAPAS